MEANPEHLSPQTLTQAEQRAILRATADNPRDHLIYSLALGTGLRLAEIVGLNVGDVYTPERKPRNRIRLRAEIANGGIDCWLDTVLGLCRLRTAAVHGKCRPVMVTVRQVLRTRCGRGGNPGGTQNKTVRSAWSRDLAATCHQSFCALEKDGPMSTSNLVPPLLPRGTFTGVPTHFRGWCFTASRGGDSGGYRWVGRHFGRELLSLDPEDLMPAEWLTLVDRMVKQCLDHGERGKSLSGLECTDRAGLEFWLRRHFPLMMRLVPKDRMQRFIDGFVEAYTEGEMLEDFPGDFEPVDVDLDDPCGGDGYIRRHYHRPPPREVVYQCPAPSCREASRAAVEEYAAKQGLPVVDLGETIATVDLN